MTDDAINTIGNANAWIGYAKLILTLLKIYNHKIVVQPYNASAHNITGEKRSATTSEIPSIVLPLLPTLKSICPQTINNVFIKHNMISFIIDSPYSLIP
jgi:hypothetical protein